MHCIIIIYIVYFVEVYLQIDPFLDGSAFLKETEDTIVGDKVDILGVVRVALDIHKIAVAQGPEHNGASIQDLGLT